MGEIDKGSLWKLRLEQYPISMSVQSPFHQEHKRCPFSAVGQANAAVMVQDTSIPQLPKGITVTFILEKYFHDQCPLSRRQLQFSVIEATQEIKRKWGTFVEDILGIVP